jgi:hypothetical protein
MFLTAAFTTTSRDLKNPILGRSVEPKRFRKTKIIASMIDRLWYVSSSIRALMGEPRRVTQ